MPHQFEDKMGCKECNIQVFDINFSRNCGIKIICDTIGIENNCPCAECLLHISCSQPCDKRKDYRGIVDATANRYSKMMHMQRLYERNHQNLKERLKLLDED